MQVMTINKQIIKRNSAKVFSVMKRMCRYSFQELQCCTQLETTELCLALLQLLQERLIEQDRDARSVYYALSLQ
ncbi:hypothetical protein B5G17_08545 [Bacteroides uniformis]|uniref:Uncharacterized protein n=1 Tax=Bacteroides uniformis TaxID=820 RepID=A0A1Y3V3V6_BACUN|nr:hypothetical protein B5G17_08545 [Bacteroides uniformis]